MLRLPLSFLLVGRSLLALLSASIVTLVGHSSVAAAMPVSASERDYEVRVWTTDDGLPHNSVNLMVQDRTGFLWFATLGGVARFDGREFREYLAPPEHRTQGFNIRGLAEERPGTLLVVPTSGAVLRLSDGNWEVHPVTKALNEYKELPNNLYVTPDGVLWIGTISGAVVRWDSHGDAKIFDGTSKQATLFRKATFATDDSGTTWIASDSLLATEDNARLSDFEQAPLGPIMIASSHTGKIWVCSDGLLQRLENGRLVIESDAVPWKGEVNAVRQIFEDSRGLLWIVSSRHNLYHYSEGQFHLVPTPFSAATSIGEDREGNLWLTTDRGVAQLREKAYLLYDISAGLKHEVVSSVTKDKNGRIYLANRTGGIACVDRDGVLRTGDGRSPPLVYANVVTAATNGRVWFGGGQSGLVCWDPSDPAQLKRLTVPSVNLHVLFPAPNGDVWFAADPNIVGFYRDDQPHLVKLDGVGPGMIRCITQDAAGQIWLGGSEGELFHWNGERLERFDASRGFPKQPIHTLYADTSNRLWIGTAAGLILKERDDFFVLTRDHGLVDDIILSIVEDNKGRLWIASRRGLFYVDKNELVKVAHTPSKHVSSFIVGRNHGLAGLNPTANYQPAACRASDGKLWFATAQGALVVDPEKLTREPPPPPVVIDEVLLNGLRVSAVLPLRIPSGKQRLELRLSALSYTAPEHVRLRHRLEGIDSQWVDTSSDRIITYTSLPPGDYQLHVIARNSTGRWSTTETTLAIAVVPAWWETVSFRMLTLALLIGLTAWGVRLIGHRRLRRKLKRLEQEHTLEKERVRIARDLHDELGAGLTEVGMMAERIGTTSSDQAAGALTDLAWRTRRLSTELSGIVWALNSHNSTLNRLADFVRQYTLRLFNGLSINCVIKNGDHLPLLPVAPDAQHHLIAATKEALNNVLKHSRATEVSVELQYQNDWFEIIINDNGRGFMVNEARELDGNGLRNIQSRIAEIGGDVAISSEPNRGTRVTLRVKLPKPISIN